MQGEIVKIIRHRGFGFINTEGQDDDIFFHHSALKEFPFEDLKEGTEVEFDVEETEKGPQAQNIRVNTMSEEPDFEEPDAMDEMDEMDDLEDLEPMDEVDDLDVDDEEMW